MQATELSRLNRLLGDSLGRNAFGESMYKWVQNKQLTIPTKVSDLWVPINGIMQHSVKYEQKPQMAHISHDRWVLALWLAPPSWATWVDQFGIDTPYPQRGYYFATDVLVKEGVEPNEDLTQNVIGAIRRFRHLTETDLKQDQEGKAAASDRSNESLVGDFIHDRMAAFGNIPGKRGGVTSLPEARPGLRQSVLTH